MYATGDEGNRDVLGVLVGVCEQEADRDTVQEMPEDPRKDLEVGDHQQGHGEAGVPVRRADGHLLPHAGRGPHQRPPDHLPQTPPVLLADGGTSRVDLGGLRRISFSRYIDLYDFRCVLLQSV